MTGPALPQGTSRADGAPRAVAWHPTAREVAALEAEHRERVRAADRLVAVPDLVPPGTAEDAVLAVRLSDGSRAAGLVTVTDVDPGSPQAASRALRDHRLRARAAGPDVPGAVMALLDAWWERVRTGADPEPPGAAPVDVGPPRPAPAAHGISVVWPSRDVAAAAALATSGLRPTVHLAARGDARGRPRPAPRGLVLSDATAADVDAVVEHQLAELAYDELVGSARRRPGAREAIAPQVAAAVERADSVVLVARSADGADVLGVVAVEPPRLSGWVAGAVARGPVAYVVLLHVADAARGSGVGAALVDAALGRVRDVAGPDAVVLLHHGVLNPLSAPFWARHGFRPVLTTWELAVTATT